MKRTILGLVVGVVLAAIAIGPSSRALAAKPTTTTAPTTTLPQQQVLGIPHIVTGGVPGDQVQADIMCPDGEVALGVSFTQNRQSFTTTYMGYPIQDTNGRPIGYRVWMTSPNYNGDTAYVTCAPVVTM
jgi:hypothetical protein